jgi:hypothetical protein
MLRSNKQLAGCAFLIATSAYFLGAYSLSHNVWPIEEIRATKRYLMGQKIAESTAQFDGFGRLASYPGKKRLNAQGKHKKRWHC